MPITNNGKKPYVTFENWDAGIADDVYSGYNLIKNVNVNSKGIASVQTAPTTQSFYQPTNKEMTADASTDALTSISAWYGNNPTYTTGVAFTISSTGTLPAGLTAGTIYYTVYVSSTSFKVATSFENADNNTVIDITDAGTGTHTVSFISMGEVKHFAVDSRTGYVYVLDYSGRVWTNEGGSVWRLISGNTLTQSSGNGIVVWKNYLFVIRNQYIDVYGDLSAAFASRAWTNGWKTIQETNAYGHTAIVGKDDIVYFIDGRYVGTLAENAAPFVPATAGSYTYQPNALDLPQDSVITDIEEYGQYIVLAATRGPVSYIYPWDRTSASVNIPIEVPEKSISHLVNINNVLYFLTNNRPAIYATNLSSVQLLKSLPIHLADEAYFNYGYLNITCAGKMGGNLYFGLRVGNNAGTTLNTGIYEFNIQRNSIRLDHTITGASAGYNPYVSSVFYINSYNDGTPIYHFACYNGTNYEIQLSSGSGYPYTNYESQIVTPFIVLDSNVYDNRHISEVVLYLAYPLSTGDGIKLEYRSYANESWTTVSTVTSAESGINPMIRIPCAINKNHLQFRISMKSLNTSGATWVQLRKVEII